MAQKSTTASRTSRRQMLSAGLAGLAAASATAVQAGAAQELPKLPAVDAEKASVPAAGSANRPGALLSSCIRSGHLLVPAGIGGWYLEQRKEPGDIKVQIQSALTVMKQTLEGRRLSMANVLKVHMYRRGPEQEPGAAERGLSRVLS